MKGTFHSHFSLGTFHCYIGETREHLNNEDPRPIKSMPYTYMYVCSLCVYVCRPAYMYAGPSVADTALNHHSPTHSACMYVCPMYVCSPILYTYCFYIVYIVSPQIE